VRLYFIADAESIHILKISKKYKGRLSWIESHISYQLLKYREPSKTRKFSQELKHVIGKLLKDERG